MQIPFSLSFLFLLATVGADAAWMLSDGFSLAWASAYLALLLVALLTFGAVFYARFRRDERIFHLLAAAALLMAFSAAAALLNYMAASIPLPLVDKRLIAIDHSLGFDWRTHLKWVESHLWLAEILNLAYRSMIPQIIATLVLLTLLSRYRELERFILGFMIAALLSIALACAFPAVAGYIFYNINPNALPFAPAAARIHEAHYLALRAGRMHVLMIEGAQGIITFPSFHVALGLLFVWAARVWAPAFVLSLALNLAMALSVFSQGGHYLTDALGGAAVAMASIALARLFVYKEAP